MFDQGSKIPLREQHFSQNLRKLHWKGEELGLSVFYAWQKGQDSWRWDYRQTYVTGMTRTNQKAAAGAVIRTGKKAGEAGRSEGSYQELTSSSEPG